MFMTHECSAHHRFANSQEKVKRFCIRRGKFNDPTSKLVTSQGILLFASREFYFGQPLGLQKISLLAKVMFTKN